MPLNDDLVDALTPDFPAPEAPEPRPEDGAREGPDLLRWQWSQLLLAGFAERVRQAAREVPGAWHVAVGLVPWTGTEPVLDVPGRLQEAIRESGYIWGGLILTSEPFAPGIFGDPLLWLGGGRFPIIVRHGRYRPQARELHEAGTLRGTVATWARATPNHPDCPGLEGCLTAAHVVGAGLGRYDIEEGGLALGTATAEEFSPPCLDAAFLRLPWRAAPTSFLPSAPSALAFGDPAAFDGATTGPVSGFVTHISAHARSTGSGIPMILCHDGLGNPGDSGARVDVRGLPTAMHLGKIELDNGAGDESRGVLLHQVAHVMHLEFLE